MIWRITVLNSLGDHRPVLHKYMDTKSVHRKGFGLKTLAYVYKRARAPRLFTECVVVEYI